MKVLVIGAGGGGFLMLFVPEAHQEAVRNRLNKLIHVPIDLDFGGSQIIFFDPQEDHAALDLARANQQVAAFRELDQMTNQGARR